MTLYQTLPFAISASPESPLPFIGVGAGKFLGVRRILSKFSETCPKNSKENDLKKWLHFIPFGALFFQIKALEAQFLPKFTPNLPKFPLTCPKKNWRNMTSKKRNVCTLISGAIFAKSKHIERFCEGRHTFCPNLHRFCPDFKGFFPDFHQNQNFLGWASTPFTPTCYTTGLKLASKNFHATRVDARKSGFATNTPDPFCLKC